MIFGSVCSGIEAASVAWHPLGWRAAFLSEIEKFPRAVLAHHYPDVPLHGDFTTIREGEYEPIDVLVGGTPCQDFSVAGLRAGLDGERGNLSLQYIRLVDRLRPRWVVWENVPGVLSLDEGRAFGAIIGGLAKLGYGWAYRVIDAQFFNLAQRRARVFVVGCLGDWRGPAAVLFEPASLRWNPAPRRETGEGVAATIAASTGGSSGKDAADGRSNPQPGGPSHTLPTDGHPPAIAFHYNAQADQLPGLTRDTNVTDPLTTSQGVAIAFDLRGREGGALPESAGDTASMRAASGGSSRSYVASVGVRRLTPRECERLMGFPDDYTLIDYRGKPAADGPRYKALGNSMAVPVMRWIGQRIARVHGGPR